jgi:threonylcarbamoyladenosine tRNA methylthiotransferase MtaB
MKRCYSPQYFSKRVYDIARRIDNIALGSDVIVGFPGEGDAEFAETYNLLNGLPFSYLHIFPFSPRENTEAGMMSGRPCGRALTERMNKLKDLHQVFKRGYMAQQLGRQLDVIIEEEIDLTTSLGTSGNYLKVTGSFAPFGKGNVITVWAERLIGTAIWGSAIRSL